MRGDLAGVVQEVLEFMDVMGVFFHFGEPVVGNLLVRAVRIELDAEVVELLHLRLRGRFLQGQIGELLERHLINKLSSHWPIHFKQRLQLIWLERKFSADVVVDRVQCILWRKGA